MSDDFHTHPKPGTFTPYPTDFELLEAAEAEVERLTAELAEAKDEIEVLSDGLHLLRVMQTQAEAREKALRDVLNEAFHVETVRDLYDWLERAKKGTVT